MEYKKKKLYLLSLIGFLALVYIISLAIGPEFTGSRSSSFVWLDARYTGRITGIAINSQGENIELLKRNNQWFVAHNEREYPARQLRVEDFIGIFTTRAFWPVRSSSAASHERLGVDEASASRVRFYGDNTTLLDVLLGGDDITGREIYIRKYGNNEVRSGYNLFSFYLSNAANGWFNLRLIPESEDGRLAVDNVQRLTVHDLNETSVFSRRNREWIITGLDVVNPDQSAIESYIRAVLNTEGDDFADEFTVDVTMLTHSYIVMEFGNGSTRTIWFSGPDETGRRLARVDGFDYIYSIAPWAVNRLFRNAQDFERQ